MTIDRPGWEELTALLLTATVPTLLEAADGWRDVIPELAATVGFDQHSPHHAYDVYTHTAYVTQAVPAEPVLRWAALLHDIGKVPTFTRDAGGRGHFYGHAEAGARMADAVLQRLGAPEALRREAVWLIGHHMSVLKPEAETLRQYAHKEGFARLHRLRALQEADMHSKGTREHAGNDRFRRVGELLTELEQEETL